MKAIRNILLNNKIGTILNTCNNDNPWQMVGGNIPDLNSPTYVRTINFGQGSNITRELDILRTYQTTGVRRRFCPRESLLSDVYSSF